MSSASRGWAGPRPDHAGILTVPFPHGTGFQMQDQTGSAEQQLAGAMGRIGLLDGQTDALKVKRANNSLAATRAQEAAGAARDRAGEAKQVGERWAWGADGGPAGVPLTGPTAQQVLEGPLRDRYRTAQELVEHRAQGAQQAGSRAQRLRDEAARLLRDTQGKLQQLRGEAGAGDLEVVVGAGGGGGQADPFPPCPRSAGGGLRAERAGAGCQSGPAGWAGGQDEGGAGHHQPAGPDLQHLPVIPWRGPDPPPPPALTLPPLPGLCLCPGAAGRVGAAGHPPV